MGIDKQNVRFIIHALIPTIMVEYYQQCGGAGRNGLPATCILYYRCADKNSLFKLFKKLDGSSVVNQMTLDNELIHFLENPVECRHKCIMVYLAKTSTILLVVPSMIIVHLQVISTLQMEQQML